MMGFIIRGGNLPCPLVQVKLFNKHNFLFTLVWALDLTPLCAYINARPDPVVLASMLDLTPLYDPAVHDP